MSAETSPLQDRSSDMLRLFPRLIAYARGLGCSEEEAPALVRDVALEALDSRRWAASPDQLEEALRREIGVRCLQARPIDGAAEGDTRGEYLEGMRIAQKELQRNFEALDRIDPALRRIFVLRVISRMSSGDIARALGLTARAVKTRVARAMKEVAAMRRDPRAGAVLRLAPASARMATDVAGAAEAAPRQRRERRSGDRRSMDKAGNPLPVAVGKLRVLHGGKKWNGPDMV